MTSGFGVDPTKDGTGAITSGTTSQDIQQIYGGLYSPGLVSGAAITTSASAMTYSVAAGTGVIPVSTGSNIPIPIPATVVNASPGGSATRTDIIYAQQRFPSIEGDSSVIVNVGPTLPPRAITLGTYTVPANVTNTNAATGPGDITYSVPYGVGRGLLFQSVYTTSGNLPSNVTRIGYGSIYLPTDRRLRFKVSAVLYAQGASGFDNAHYCEYYFLPNIDNNDMVIWTSTGLHQAWGTYNFDYDLNVSAGHHTVNLGMGRKVGPGTAATFFGTDTQGYGRRGITYSIEDIGVTI
jgi:hypothetical protein